MILYPDYDYKNIYDIPYEHFKNMGIKGIIFDIDNTLTKHGAVAVNKDIKFFDRLREMGFDTILLSNNKEKRVKAFANIVSSKYICRAKKPQIKNYLKAARLMNLKTDEVIFVGDQIFTDILGARLAKITAILVNPIDKSEEIQIVIKRNFEKIVLFFYNRYKKRLKNV